MLKLLATLNHIYLDVVTSVYTIIILFLHELLDRNLTCSSGCSLADFSRAGFWDTIFSSVLKQASFTADVHMSQVL